MDPKECRYNYEHRWVHPESGKDAKMGLAPYTLWWHLGEIVVIHLAPAGTKVGKWEKIGDIEAVKATIEIFSPLSVQVKEINEEAVSEPMRVNRDPFGSGWLLKVLMTDPSELNQLIGSEEYARWSEKVAEGGRRLIERK